MSFQQVPQTLASDTDRDVAAHIMGEAYAEGRLTADEHGERVRAAYAARRWQELDRLTADLPAPPGPDSAAAVPGGLDAWRLDKCLMCALLIVCPPAGIIWLLAARYWAGPGRGRAQQHAWIPAGGRGMLGQ